MMGRALLCLGLLAAALSAWCGPSLGADLAIVGQSPSALAVRITSAQPGLLYRVTYRDARHTFVWDNLAPDSSGLVTLTDDRHLRPEYRLRCESRLGRVDPVVFDDLLKGPVAGRRRLPYGVPVSTFGGAGYLVPGLSDLRRDDFGNFWLYLDHPPYAVLKYDSRLDYQFALLTPDRVLAHDLDAEGNLYLLHPDNWVSKHSPLGEALGAWELPIGRDPGRFISASGLAIDRLGGFIYLADEALGRVQRVSLDLELRPFLHTAWGWIGREDLAFTAAGKYDPETTYYQLDRPRQLRLDDQGHLFVSCEHYVSKFDLATGRQLPFGPSPVLGWGGNFADSVLSPSAGLDGHWQRQWLAGIDEAGNIYIGDRKNEFVLDPRLQVFSPEGQPIQTLDVQHPLSDGAGRPVYVTAVAGLASAGDAIWLVDAAGRIYESHGRPGLRPGGRLYLGAGAAGRQFDLSGVEEAGLSLEPQSARTPHQMEGIVLGFPAPGEGTGNCEREGRPQLDPGETSLWMTVRLGEPFRVSLSDAQGQEIPASQYRLEVEEKPGLFGTVYDFFRVTNLSGSAWQEVRFLAETTG